MKKLTENLGAKITAIFLSFIAFAAALASVITIIFLLDNDCYTKTRDEVKTDIMENRLGSGHIYNIYDLYNISTNYNDKNNIEEYCDDNRIYYSIEDYKSGEMIESNYTGQSYLVKRSEKMNIYEERVSLDEEGNEYWYEAVTGSVNITVYITEGALSGNGQLLLNVVDTAYTLRYAVLVVLGVSVVMLLVMLCYLYAAVGHRKGGVIALNRLDRVPFDLLTAAVAGIAIISGLLISEAALSGDLTLMFVLAVVLSADYFVALGYTLSFATRLKTRTLLKNNIIYKLWFIAGKGIKKLFGWVRYLFKNIPTVAKTAIITSAVALFQVIILSILPYYYSGERILLLLLFAVADVAVIISLSILLKRIKEGGEKIAAGDLEHKIDTKYMYGDFKDFANSLNNINEGLSIAINEKIKSERFKTELITNVSHDIKTPLTSIINYVDLIKKEEPENENIREYIDVLDRQSSRLKKLIEDLMEASKASTGNLAVNLSVCEAGVLLSQTVGEFDERLKAAGLTPVVSIPETPVKIMADGRHLWRVFDNLMNNICKYSQVGTRVYLNVSERDGKAQITFRNISKYELNITDEELTERFVRGDKSRNTEGSGLGLSIAKSLTELQNGSLKIDIDGDLFKVTLTFDTV